MRLDASKQHLTVAGRPSEFDSRRELIASLQAVCSSVSTRLTKKTTAFVLCERDWVLDVERQATQRGIPFLTEAQAIELINEGFVELEDATDSDTPLDALIGEVRSLLDGEPSARTWDALVALLDRCVPEHERALADYLCGALERWRVPPHARYTLAEPPEDHYAQLWSDACPTGYLRVAPQRWLAEALRGEPSPKFMTVDALVLHPLDLSNPNVEALLANPSFSRVRHLDPRIILDDPTGRVFKALASSPMAKNLDSLVLPCFEPKHARALKAESDLALRRLTIAPRYPSAFDSDASQKLVASSWLEELEEFVFHGSHATGHAFPDAFTTLHTLDTLTIHFDWWLNYVTTPLRLAPPARTVVIVGRLGGVNDPLVLDLLDTHLEHARTLDVSRLMPLKSDDPAQDAHAIDLVQTLIDRFPTSTFGRSFEAIRLGRWYTDRLADAFDTNGVTVLDTPADPEEPR